MKLFKFFVFICCLFPDFAMAQHLTGRVLDDRTLQPLSWVNVVLLESVDSSFVEGTVTDSLGFFSLSSPVKENFLLKISSMDINRVYSD